MNGYVKALDPDFAKDFRAAANMAGNLNQLAYQASKAGFSSVAKDMLDLRSRLRIGYARHNLPLDMMPKISNGSTCPGNRQLCKRHQGQGHNNSCFSRS